jgi:hypothetical protein
MSENKIVIRMYSNNSSCYADAKISIQEYNTLNKKRLLELIEEYIEYLEKELNN